MQVFVVNSKHKNETVVKILRKNPEDFLSPHLTLAEAMAYQEMGENAAARQSLQYYASSSSNSVWLMVSGPSMFPSRVRRRSPI